MGMTSLATLSGKKGLAKGKGQGGGAGVTPPATAGQPIGLLLALTKAS